MLVKERYATANDAQQQLHNTIVVLDGTPRHIYLSEDWQYKSRRVLDNRKDIRWSEKSDLISIRNMDLTLEPIKLGYINDHNGVARYIQRKPLRKWKQGLYPEYLTIKNGLNLGLGRNISEYIRGLLQSDGFIQMYYDKYPSFYRAYVDVRMLNKNSMAFHRHWAFARAELDDKVMRRGAAAIGLHRPRAGEIAPNVEVNLLYKGEVVGECDGANIRMYKKFEYLLEAFTEAMIHAS